MKRLIPLALVLAFLGGCADTGGTRGTRLPDAPPPGEPAGTTGLRDAELKAAYGQPALVRRDANGQIWRFDAPGCKAFFFLYSKDGKTAVWHVETMPRGASIAADQNCLNALRARGAAPRPTS